MFRMFTAIFLISALEGCATSSEVFLADGSKGYNINCSGAALNYGHCLEKAGQICGLRGYLVINKHGDVVPFSVAGGGYSASALAASGGFHSLSGAIITRSLFVKCKVIRTFAEWVFSFEVSDTVYYINPDSIRKSGNTVKMWYLGDFKDVPKTNIKSGKKVLSYKNRSEYKCEERQLRSIYQVQYSEHMSEGKVVHTYYEPDKWKAVIPDTVGEAHLKIACGK